MKESTKIFLGLIIGSVIIAAGLYFGLKEGLKNISTNKITVSQNQDHNTKVTPLPSNTPTPQETPTPSATPTPAEISWTKSDIIKALSKKTHIPEGEIKFSIGQKVTKKDKVLIKGAVSRKGEMGGAGFFGVINEEGVNITYVGQGVPRCSEVNPYGYPLSWADYCVKDNGQVVRRS